MSQHGAFGVTEFTVSNETKLNKSIFSAAYGGKKYTARLHLSSFGRRSRPI
jgi:hypothetical protein